MKASGRTNLRPDRDYEWWAFHYSEEMLKWQAKAYKAADRNTRYVVFYTFLSIALLFLGFWMGTQV